MRVRSRSIALAAVAATTVALALTLIPAGAAASGNYIPWPSLLPGRTVGPSGPPAGLAGCQKLRPWCVRKLAHRLGREWRQEDARCDHRAIFSLGYLRITREIGRRIRDHRSFQFRPWFVAVVQGFSNLYFQTQRRYDAGREVPGSWRIYYEAMDSGDYNAGQDLLLASNAHTNHDLPYAYAAAGLLTRKGVSRKPDHDEVNDVNATVFESIADYYEHHYDPFFALTNALHPFDQASLSQIVQIWRENAWRQAERLVSAKSEADLQAVQRQIERTSTAYAKLITAGAEPGHRQVRDSFCRAQQGG